MKTFPLQKKIDKRGRKLVDYDSQRHQLENLQRASRRDEYKIARARDALETARTTYEALNKVSMSGTGCYCSTVYIISHDKQYYYSIMISNTYKKCGYSNNRKFM